MTLEDIKGTTWQTTTNFMAYRWVVLAVFMFINLTIQMLWITYAPITGPAADVLWRDRLADRFAGDVVHDRVHPAFHPGLVGDRHIRLQTGGQHRRGVDGNLRSLARICRRKLFPRFVEHDRDCGGSAVPAQRLDEGPCQLVCHRRTRHRSWIGDARQSGRYGARHGVDSNPHRDHFHSNGSIDLRRHRGILGSLVCRAGTRNSAHTARTRRKRSPRADAGWTEACAHRQIILALFIRLIYWAWEFSTASPPGWRISSVRADFPPPMRARSAR